MFDSDARCMETRCSSPLRNRASAVVSGSASSFASSTTSSPEIVKLRPSCRSALAFMAARPRIGEERFIDVYNRDVVSRPIETFERVYDHIGLDLSPELVARLEHYNQSNAPGAFGKHSYTLEEYGMTEADVATAFADYLDRFDP